MESVYEYLIVVLTNYGFTLEVANELLKSFLDEQAEKYINYKFENKIKDMFPGMFN